MSTLVAIVTACWACTSALRAPAPAARANGWSYEIVVAREGTELAAQASFPPGTDIQFSVADGAEPFVRDVAVWTGSAWGTVTSRDGTWTIPSCATGCRVAYRFLLREAGLAVDDREVARAHTGAVDAPPSTWLLRPIRAAEGTPMRFHVASAPGDAFVAGVFPTAGATDTYDARVSDAWHLPYAAFGRLRRRLCLGGKVEVTLLPGALAREEDVLAWVEASARAVEAFYGRFPVDRLLVLIEPVGGVRAGFGTTMGSSGAAVSIAVGRDATRASLADDWILVHEMVHTALPDVTREHHWLEEGLATYVEPLARAHAGRVAPIELWREWLAGMPKGLPDEGDLGLDRTHTWGRTYWGGALFCLEADIAIRERTGNRRSLRDALRAVVAQGGNIAVSWPIEKVLDVGDDATGVHVLRETYARTARRPEPIDLARLWSRLGVREDRAGIVFDDEAPLAVIRRAMTEAR